MKQAYKSTMNVYDHSGDTLIVYNMHKFDSLSKKDKRKAKPIFQVEIQKKIRNAMETMKEENMEFIGCQYNEKTGENKELISNIFISSDLYDLEFTSVHD